MEMKLSRLPRLMTAVDYRANAEKDLDIVQFVAERDLLLAEISFFYHEDGNRNRVFSADGHRTRMPYDEVAFREFKHAIVTATKTDLLKEIESCNRTLTNLGIEVDQ
ncbi:MAG: hypothetical protein SFW09_10520 [Hyphomicrobiaceae bacterium]|nr:hypothetical protein [Hyphomicrobiaceae bacterium]